jgi:hypothetical protein
MTTMEQVARLDGYANEPPAGEWSYVIDETGIAYRRGLIAQRLRPGWWPFAFADSGREQSERHRHYPAIRQECGVAWLRLAPDSKFWAWRNEYVLVGPDREVPHLAHASVTLWAGDRVTLPCEIHLDLSAGTYELGPLPEDAPADVIAHAHLKGAKLVKFLADACIARDGTEAAPVTAADLEDVRVAKRTEKIRAYCAASGLSFKASEHSEEYFTISGERMSIVQIAVKYLPGLFSDPAETADEAAARFDNAAFGPQDSDLAASD